MWLKREQAHLRAGYLGHFDPEEELGMAWTMTEPGLVRSFERIGLSPMRFRKMRTATVYLA
jgi:hypothetical protein